MFFIRIKSIHKQTSLLLRCFFIFLSAFKTVFIVCLILKIHYFLLNAQKAQNLNKNFHSDVLYMHKKYKKAQKA